VCVHAHMFARAGSLLMDWCTGGVGIVAWADGQSIYACGSIFSVSENMGLCSYLNVSFFVTFTVPSDMPFHVFYAILCHSPHRTHGFLSCNAPFYSKSIL